MKKKKILAYILVAFLLLSFPVFAGDDEENKADFEGVRREVRMEDSFSNIRDENRVKFEEKKDPKAREEFRRKGNELESRNEKKVKEARKFLKRDKVYNLKDREKELDEGREASREGVERRELFEKKKVENFREKLREELRKRFEKRRESLQKKLEEFRREREERLREFKEKLKEIKDERKKKIVERVNERIGKLNERRSEILLALADRLEKIFEKVGALINLWQERGADVALARQKLEALKDRLAAFRIKAEEQKKKSYVVKITNESTLGQAVSATYKSLLSDLKALKEEFIGIRKDLRGVVLELKEAIKAMPKPATPSPSPVSSPAAGL